MESVNGIEPACQSCSAIEAKVGFEQVWPLSAVSNPHPQRLRHQRHAASCASNIPIIRHFCVIVKHQTLLSQYQSNTHQLLIHHPFTGTFLLISARRDVRFATAAYRPSKQGQPFSCDVMSSALTGWLSCGTRKPTRQIASNAT